MKNKVLVEHVSCSLALYQLKAWTLLDMPEGLQKPEGTFQSIFNWVLIRMNMVLSYDGEDHSPEDHSPEYSRYGTVLLLFMQVLSAFSVYIDVWI